jgi:hypothetical protein
MADEWWANLEGVLNLLGIVSVELVNCYHSLVSFYVTVTPSRQSELYRWKLETA